MRILPNVKLITIRTCLKVLITLILTNSVALALKLMPKMLIFIITLHNLLFNFY